MWMLPGRMSGNSTTSVVDAVSENKINDCFWYKTTFFLALNEIKMISFKGPQISSQRIAVPDTELIIFRWH